MKYKKANVMKFKKKSQHIINYDKKANILKYNKKSQHFEI